MVEFTSSKAGGLLPATLLKVNSSTGTSLWIFQNFWNTCFWEHLWMATYVWHTALLQTLHCFSIKWKMKHEGQKY